MPRTVQLDLIQANMGADTSPYNRDFCYGSVTVLLRLRYVFMTSQGKFNVMYSIWLKS